MSASAKLLSDSNESVQVLHSTACRLMGVFQAIKMNVLVQSSFHAVECILASCMCGEQQFIAYACL